MYCWCLILFISPSLQDTPATVGVVGPQTELTVWMLLAFSHRSLLQLEPEQNNQAHSCKPFTLSS